MEVVRLTKCDLGDVIGQGNDALLSHVAAQATHALLAWGATETSPDAARRSRTCSPPETASGPCQNGEPLHPARKARSLEFSRYRP